MNYYKASELADKDGKPAGLWHYTVTNDHKTRPTGFCADGCPGHATAEEAQEHYRQYLLSLAVYDDRLSGQQRRCEVCGEWTQRLASIPFWMEHHVLCDEHCTPEVLTTLVPLPGNVTSSY